MEDARVDGRLQVTAALALLDQSGLVEWSASEMQFSPIGREVFEASWRVLHPVFGRLMCWMLFSAGAELLAKGACLCSDIDFRRERQVPTYPQGLDSGRETARGFEKWSQMFLSDWRSTGATELLHYGTLGDLIYDQRDRPALLRRFCAAREIDFSDQQLLLAAYTLLAKSIRNRDAHAYVRDVRDQHFSLVPELFTNCFNMLVAPLRQDTQPISGWKDSAATLVQVLRWPTDNAYDDKAFVGLRERLRFFDEDQTLERLVLGLYVTDAGMKGISELPALKEVYLESSELTDDCLKELTALKKLEFVQIYRGRITDRGLMTLAALSNLRAVRVRLGFTGVTKAGLQILRSRRPDLEVTE